VECPQGWLVECNLKKSSVSEEKQKLDEFEGSLDFCFFSSMEKKGEIKLLSNNQLLSITRKPHAALVRLG
jgi:hypothetical protein